MRGLGGVLMGMREAVLGAVAASGGGLNEVETMSVWAGTFRGGIRTRNSVLGIRKEMSLCLPPQDPII